MYIKTTMKAELQGYDTPILHYLCRFMAEKKLLNQFLNVMWMNDNYHWVNNQLR